ncbi:MAG: putative adhesin [Gemmatimonadaceae bacterium]
MGCWAGRSGCSRVGDRDAEGGARSTAPAARRPPGQISRGPRCGPTNLRRIRKSPRCKVPAGDSIHSSALHGAALLDPGLSNFAKQGSKAIPVASLKGGDTCKNYLLTAYQSAQSGVSGTAVGETDEDIRQAVDNRDWQRNDRFNTLIKAKPDQMRAAYDALAADWGAASSPFGIAGTSSRVSRWRLPLKPRCKPCRR